MNVMSCQRSLFKTQRTDEELLLDEVFFSPHDFPVGSRGINNAVFYEWDSASGQRSLQS